MRFALAHSYDIGGQPDRAYGFVALGERLRDTAMDVSGLVHPLEPHSIGPALGLRSRAFSFAKAPRRDRVAGFKRGASGALAGRRPAFRRRKSDRGGRLSQSGAFYALETEIVVSSEPGGR